MNVILLSGIELPGANSVDLKLNYMGLHVANKVLAIHPLP